LLQRLKKSGIKAAMNPTPKLSMYHSIWSDESKTRYNEAYLSRGATVARTLILPCCSINWSRQ